MAGYCGVEAIDAASCTSRHGIAQLRALCVVLCHVTVGVKVTKWGGEHGCTMNHTARAQPLRHLDKLHISRA